MSEEISPELFTHLVDLAAIALDDSQSDYLRSELNNQLNAIHELAAIPLDDSVPSALHGVSYQGDVRAALREDEWQPFEDPQAIINQAPESAERYIVVPDIPHTKLD